MSRVEGAPSPGGGRVAVVDFHAESVEEKEALAAFH